MNIDGKTALITGGAVRIGRAICEELAERGCNIVIHYNRSAKEAVNLATKLRKSGVESWIVRGDLSSETDCRRILSDAFKMAGDICILVNNAAIFHKDNLMSVTEGKFKTELDINYFAPVILTKEFARIVYSRFKKKIGSNAGRIVNLLDRRIASTDPSCLPYLLSKKMLAEFTRSSALTLAPYITVNGVAPGAVLPPPGGAQKKGKYLRSGDSGVKDLAGKIPMEKRCTPGDVAEAVVFLIESDGITGQVIFVDGGQHLLGDVSEY